jgi:hypothetical protein
MTATQSVLLSVRRPRPSIALSAHCLTSREPYRLGLSENSRYPGVFPFSRRHCQDGGLALDLCDRIVIRQDVKKPSWLALEIVQKLRRRLDASDEEMIASARAGDVKKLSLGIVDFLEVAFVADFFDAVLGWNNFVVARHHDHGTKAYCTESGGRKDGVRGSP